MLCRDIAGDILKDPELAAAVHGIGCHYPGTHSSAEAVQTGKPLWASEDDSTYNNVSGHVVALSSCSVTSY